MNPVHLVARVLRQLLVLGALLLLVVRSRVMRQPAAVVQQA
jgi:hypothetical protein